MQGEGQAVQQTVTVALDEAPAAPVRILAPGTRFGERYEIREVLGSGGSAVVYRAFDRELKREVALKVLRAERMSEATLKRFRREAAVARDAASPRLVRTFDIGSSDGAIFLTMEAIDGPSLRQRLEDGPLAVAEAIRITIEVLEGLRVLHSLGIIHRDIKPGNILLSRDGVKLADFGLARRFEQPETRVTIAEAPLGTLEYMAPEQVLAQELDARADLYSLGLVLFEMLAGEIPCQRRSSLGTLLAHLESSLPDVRQLRPDAPRWISRIVARLLEKQPAARYQSADAVLADLRSRRFPLFRTRRFRRFAAAAILAMAIGLGLWLALGRSSVTTQYPRLVGLEGSGVAAIGRHGETLWTLPDVDPGIVPRSIRARLSPGGPPHLAVVLRRKAEYLPEVVRKLSFLDPETGTIVKQVNLVSGARMFPSHSDRYRPEVVRAEDLDGDGIDEILVAYTHIPEWPFYAVLYEPRFERSRLVFLASGHHPHMAAEDLDGDGRAELIFAGINNLLGWYNAVAAVRLVPWIGEDLGDRPVAYSPDDPRSGKSADLLWYALIPRGLMLRHAALTTDRSGTLWIPHLDGHRQPLGLDGFLPLPASQKPSAVRQEHRRQAYLWLHEAQRLLRAGFAAEAIAEAETAVNQAEEAEAPLLVECMGRFQGKILSGADRITAAEALFEKLARESPNASEIAFDAGEALHLRGELERAVRWYRRGTGPGGSESAGKSKYEFLEGAISALVELGRWQEAQEEVARFEAAYGASNACTIFRELIRWRSGEMPRRLEDTLMTPYRTDLQRYWLLEFRNARSLDVAELLPAVEHLVEEASEARGPVLSLEAELLLKLGRNEEALDVARRAFDLLIAERLTSTLARAHLDLVAARFARAARANQREEEGSRAEQMAREMLARPGAS